MTTWATDLRLSPAAGDAVTDATVFATAPQALGDASPLFELTTLASVRAQITSGQGVYTVTDPACGAVLDSTTDNAAKIQAYLNTLPSGSKLVVPIGSGTCGIKSHLSVPAGVELGGPGQLTALSGFTDNYMVLMASGAKLTVATMDGTGCPVPTGAWTGGGIGLARAPVGCAVFINGVSGTVIPNCVISVDTFQNFPSGPVCAFYADGITVTTRRYVTVQTYTGGETNGVCAFNNTINGRIYGGLIDGYNWKGYYFGNCTECVAYGSWAKNGATGMASHYDSGGSHCGFVGCGHDGSGTGGDGHKAFQSAYTFVRGFTSKGSTGAGVYFDGCSDWEASGLDIQDWANGAVYIAADNGACVRGKVTGFSISRAAQGTTANHAALKFSPNASHAIDEILFDQGTVDNAFYGVVSLNVSSGVVSHVTFGKGLTFTRTNQYDIIGYFQSVDVGCHVIRTAASASNSDVFLSTASGVGGELCKIDGLRVTGFGSGELMCEITGTWDVVDVTSLTTRNGGKALIVDAGAIPSNLILNQIVAFNAGQTNAVDINLSTANATNIAAGRLLLGSKAFNVTLTNGATAVYKQGFYGVAPIDRAVLATGAAHTVDDVITALQNLGLVKQS